MYYLSKLIIQWYKYCEGHQWFDNFEKKKKFVDFNWSTFILNFLNVHFSSILLI